MTLYQLLHTNELTQILEGELLQTKIKIKYDIALQIARIMLTIHNLGSLKNYGHLTSHNIFVTLKKIGSGTFEISVRISDLENFDFMEYGNMFYNYKISSVWSAPEVLRQPRKIQEVNTQMDVYSYGMILWELWHESVPFDNDLNQAI